MFISNIISNNWTTFIVFIERLDTDAPKLFFTEILKMKLNLAEQQNSTESKISFG